MKHKKKGNGSHVTQKMNFKEHQRIDKAELILLTQFGNTPICNNAYRL